LSRFYLPWFEYVQEIPGMALLIYNDWGYDLIEGYKAMSVVKLQKLTFIGLLFSRCYSGRAIILTLS
jgi:hypothetical protein